MDGWDHDRKVKNGFELSNKERTLPVQKKGTSRSLKVDTPETVAPIHIFSRVGPKIPKKAVFRPLTVNSEVYITCI